MNEHSAKPVAARVNVSSGSPYEPIIGFSRAVRVGNIVAVGGTTAGSSGKPGRRRRSRGADPRHSRNHREGFADAGASLKDVIRTRIYLVDIAHWEAVGRVHGEVFGDIRPASEHPGGLAASSIRTGSSRSRPTPSFRPLEGEVMAPRKAEDCANMDEVRAEIDRIDATLVDLIGERFSYVDRAWQFKQSPAEARVPWRIQQVIDKVRARAVEKGLPPELAEALWRQMIGWFIQYEEEKLRGKGDDT